MTLPLLHSSKTDTESLSSQHCRDRQWSTCVLQQKQRQSLKKWVIQLLSYTLHITRTRWCIHTSLADLRSCPQSDHNLLKSNPMLVSAYTQQCNHQQSFRLRSSWWSNMESNVSMVRLISFRDDMLLICWTLRCKWAAAHSRKIHGKVIESDWFSVN